VPDVRESLAEIAARNRRAALESPGAGAAARRGRHAGWHLPVAAGHEPENWLLTYLDLLTLLLVMMLVLLAHAGPGLAETKTKAAARGPVALVGTLRAAPAAPPGSGWHAAGGVLAGSPSAPAPAGAPLALAPPAPGLQAPAPPAFRPPASGPPASVPAPSAPRADPAPSSAPAPASPGLSAASEPPAASGSGAPDGGDAAAPPPKAPTLQALGLADLGKDIEVIVNRESISLRISSEILFASGQAALTPGGLALLDRLSAALRRNAYRIAVEGHTDPVPIRTDRYPSNWELSTARATSVLRRLQESGIAPARLRATGYADTRPVAPNADAAGRAANRRVELILETGPRR